MANLRVSLSARGAVEYRELATRMRQKGRADLRKRLRGKIADAGRPVVDEVKQAVLSLPITSHGGGAAQRRHYNVARASTARAKKSAERRHTGLRQTVASAIALQQTAKGIRIVVRSARLPEDQRTLPRHLDSEKGWRHPVFGNKSNWVHQQGRPYFASTIKKRAPQFRQAVLDAMDEIAQEIEG